LNQQAADDDQIKWHILSDDESERMLAADAIYACYGQALASSIAFHHPGLNLPDKQEVLLRSIERFISIARAEPLRLDKCLKPQLLRTAYNVGRERYRQLSRRREHEVGDLISEIAEALRDSKLGQTWHSVVDSSFRERVRDVVLDTAARLKPRQRQIAFLFAETWHLELTEKEYIAEIFRTSGERLTRDKFKRAFDEVKKKLREPILKLLEEEGYGRNL